MRQAVHAVIDGGAAGKTRSTCEVLLRGPDPEATSEVGDGHQRLRTEIFEADARVPTTQKGAIRQVDDHGQTEVGKEIRSGTLPDLNKMLQNTDQHVKQVQDGSKKQD